MTAFLKKQNFSSYARPWNNPEGIYAFVRREKELGALPGREWSVDELRLKSFDDLHKLWWILIKERNALTTERDWYRSVKREWNGEVSLEKVNLSMANLKQVVSEQKEFVKGLLEVSDLVQEDERMKKLIEQSKSIIEAQERLKREREEKEKQLRKPYRLSPRKQKQKMRRQVRQVVDNPLCPLVQHKPSSEKTVETNTQRKKKERPQRFCDTIHAQLKPPLQSLVPHMETKVRVLVRETHYLLAVVTGVVYCIDSHWNMLLFNVKMSFYDDPWKDTRKESPCWSSNISPTRYSSLMLRGENIVSIQFQKRFGHRRESGDVR
eukprot:jgi/Galph1/2319/GphlegSOOS_G1025.1